MNVLVESFVFFAKSFLVAHRRLDDLENKNLFFIGIVAVAVAERDFVNAFEHHRDEQRNIRDPGADESQSDALDAGNSKVQALG